MYNEKRPLLPSPWASFLTPILSDDNAAKERKRKLKKMEAYENSVQGKSLLLWLTCQREILNMLNINNIITKEVISDMEKRDFTCCYHELAKNNCHGLNIHCI